MIISDSDFGYIVLIIIICPIDTIDIGFIDHPIIALKSLTNHQHINIDFIRYSVVRTERSF